MNVPTTLTSLSAAALLWAAPTSTQQSGLTPVDEPMGGLSPVQEPARPAFRALESARALRADSIAERTRAFEAVLEAAREDDAALEQVRAWAADEDGDRELAWTATLLLRELASQPHGRTKARRTSPFRINGDPFDTSWIDEVFEELGGRDPLQGFRGDPFEALRRSPLGGGDPFDAFGPGGARSGSSRSLSITPDGVKLEVRETVDGETETKTYEAESLEALYEAHPELEEDAGPRLRFDVGGRALRGFGFDEADDLFERRWQGAGPGLRAVEPSLDYLGVRMLEPAKRTTVFEGVSSEVGLEVVEVVPGSLADAIGVEPGELVWTIAGEEIASAADVKRVLRGLDLGQRIDVECVTPDGGVRVRSWTP